MTTATGAAGVPLRTKGRRLPPELEAAIGRPDTFAPRGRSGGRPDERRLSPATAAETPSHDAASVSRHVEPRLWLAERLLPGIVCALGRTLRYEVHNLEALRHAREGSPDGRVIYCCWHGTHLPLVYFVRGRGIRILESRSRDGEISARVHDRLGFRTIRGSTSRGAAPAVLQALRGLDSGDLAVTPDGPRGPRACFQAGAIFVAAHSGLPLVPVGCDADRGWHLSSWDRFLIPAPFARVRLVIGDPLFVPADVSGEARERMRRRAEQALASVAGTAAGVRA